MEQLSLNGTIGWPCEKKRCTLCDCADDAGTAMAYLKQLDTALGGRVTDDDLASTMVESYNTFFREPMLKAGQDPPELTEEEITRHFTRHDINPLRQLQVDINRMNDLQDSLAPREQTSGGRIVCNDAQAKRWADLQRLKMDMIKQYQITDRQTSRAMPTL